MAPPTSFNMGFLHTPGELPRGDEALATPDYSCQPIYPHPKVESVTSFSGTIQQHSTPISYTQLFESDPFFLTLIKPSQPNEIFTFGPPATSADPPVFSSSHESNWTPWPIGKPMGSTSYLNPDFPTRRYANDADPTQTRHYLNASLRWSRTGHATDSKATHVSSTLHYQHHKFADRPVPSVWANGIRSMANSSNHSINCPRHFWWFRDWWFPSRAFGYPSW